MSKDKKEKKKDKKDQDGDVSMAVTEVPEENVNAGFYSCRAEMLNFPSLVAQKREEREERKGCRRSYHKARRSFSTGEALGSEKTPEESSQSYQERLLTETCISFSV